MLSLALLALAAPATDDINFLCRTPPPVTFTPGDQFGSEARKYQGAHTGRRRVSFTTAS